MILENFIESNDLSFEEGQRNSNCTVLAGFALFKNIPLQECIETLKKDYPEDDELLYEMERVYNYAQANNYGNYWETSAAKDKYIF